ATTNSLPEGMPKGSPLTDGTRQISVTGPLYRGPGAGANCPFHHYMFELFALDIMLDVQPTADAFETRANIMKALQGHILGKAGYGGLFRRPQERARRRRESPSEERLMCDENHYDDDVQAYTARGAVTRRQFGALVGAGV